MARRVFYSFNYKDDCWRSSQVRQIGSLDGSKAATDNDWEGIKRGGNRAIQSWIDSQLYGRSCTIVLVGRNTFNRPWIDYEIQKTWNDKKGLLGIRIHRLKNSEGKQTYRGANPFDNFVVEDNVLRKRSTFINDLFKPPLSRFVNLYDPPSWDSKEVYKYIAENIGDWVEKAIIDRNNF